MGRKAASEKERDCQGNKASRESQGQSEPTTKLEHTWAHGRAHSTGPHSRINIHQHHQHHQNQHPSASTSKTALCMSTPRPQAVLQGVAPQPHPFRQAHSIFCVGLDFFMQGTCSSSGKVAHQLHHPRTLMPKNSEPLCKTRHSLPESCISHGAPYSIFLERSKYFPWPLP